MMGLLRASSTLFLALLELLRFIGRWRLFLVTFFIFFAVVVYFQGLISMTVYSLVAYFALVVALGFLREILQWIEGQRARLISTTDLDVEEMAIWSVPIIGAFSGLISGSLIQRLFE